MAKHRIHTGFKGNPKSFCGMDVSKFHVLPSERNSSVSEAPNRCGNCVRTKLFKKHEKIIFNNG
jgi:hypothetical protein